MLVFLLHVFPELLKATSIVVSFLEATAPIAIAIGAITNAIVSIIHESAQSYHQRMHITKNTAIVRNIEPSPPKRVTELLCVGEVHTSVNCCKIQLKGKQEDLQISNPQIENSPTEERIDHSEHEYKEDDKSLMPHD